MGVFNGGSDVDSNGAQEVNLRTSAGVELLGQQASAASLPVVIASNQPAVPVTVTVVTPVAFSATFLKTAIGITELNALFLKNPSGSGKTMVIKQITLTCNHTTATSWIRWRIYSNPTTSANGTAVNARAMQVGSGATAVITPFNTPTSSALGSQLLDDISLTGHSVIQYFNREFTVAANNTVLVTALADGTNRSGTITIVWTEE